MSRALHLLWKCEVALLVEYIKSAVPLVYAISITILRSLPNAKYYPDMSEMTLDQLQSVVTSIVVFSAIEFGLLLYAHAILRWRFQLSAFHQLAFVLENEWLVMQDMLIAWTVFVLGFTLEHFGT
jgi:hypothetical protein